MYSEKATKFCEIFTLLLIVCTVVKSTKVKSKAKSLQNFVAFSEYMNFLYVLLTAAMYALKGPFMKSSWKSLYYCNIEVKGGRGSNLIILSHKKA